MGIDGEERAETAEEWRDRVTREAAEKAGPGREARMSRLKRMYHLGLATGLVLKAAADAKTDGERGVLEDASQTLMDLANQVSEES